MNKEVKITPPQCYQVDKENSTFECIRFRPVKKGLPKTWEEFCNIYPIHEGETYINNSSMLSSLNMGQRRFCVDRNILPSEEMAKAVLALCQLIQLRDYYNQGWKPNWCSTIFDKWCIEICGPLIVKEVHSTRACVLAFKTQALRDEFLQNFKDLIEIARPVL